MITGRDLRRARESRGVSLYKLAEQIGKSVSHLSRVERDADGRHPSPNVIYLYETALGVKVAATVEPVHTSTAGSNVEDVNRRDMLTATSTVALAASAAFVLPPTRAREVRPEDVHQVTVAISAFNSWDHAFGGGHALQVGKPHLDWAFTLLDDDCEPALRPKLFGAVGGLAAAAGFMAFDAFQHQQARDYFDFALDCAIQADDDNLHARVLSSMARQAVWCGRPKEAIGYMDQALAKRAHHTATELTELWTIRGRALAKLGDMHTKDALAAVGTADKLFAKSNPADDPTWIKFYDAAQHHGDTAHALFDLEVRGVKTDARPRFEYAVAHHEPGFTRSRTFSQIKLATLVMASGDPQEAAAIGGPAVGAASLIKSQRAQTELMVLRTHASQTGDAGELIERIDEAVADAAR